MKISAQMPVWNNENTLGLSIPSFIEHIDQLVIVDGGPNGPSTDNSADVIGQLIDRYGSKIEYYSGTFALKDGRWAQAEHRNFALSKMDADFLMTIDADHVFGQEDIGTIRKMVDLHPEKKVFYHNTLDFFMDLHHIFVDRDFYGRMTVGNTSVIAMDLGLSFAVERNLQGNIMSESEVRFSMKDIDVTHDVIYLPHTTKYHLGFVQPFKRQLYKHVDHVYRGGWGETGEKLIAQGRKAVLAWGINHVLQYKLTRLSREYYGKRPEALRGIEMSCYDGYEETIAELEAEYGDSFWIDRS